MNAAEALAALLPSLDAAVQSILVESRAPGAAIALVVNGRRYIKSYGYESSDAGAAPLTGRTAFDLGSCSKGFVTAAVARLVEQGRIRYDDPVQPLLAEFELDEKYLSGEVTIRDLLCNRIGLRRQIPVESFANPEISALEMIKRVCRLDRVHPFRRGYVYFNPGFMAARLIIERVSGARYEDFLDEQVFRRLKMTASASGSDSVRRLRPRARGHVIDAGRAVALPERFFDNWQGAAGVYSCALDATRWIAYQLGASARMDALAETHRSQIRIPRAECKLIHAPPEEEKVEYCMGWWKTELRGHTLVQHAGEMPGWRTQIAMLPDDGIGVAVMLSAAVSRHQVIAYTIVETLLTGTSRDWTAVARESVAAQADDVRRLSDAAFAPESGPPLPLGAYAGIYSHPACGDVRVEQNDGGLDMLVMDGRIWDMSLRPVGGHVFRGVFKDPAVRDYAVAELPLRFHVVAGCVTGLTDSNASYQRG